MSEINPFIEKIDNVTQLLLKVDLIESDILTIKHELKVKEDALTESMNNHVKSYKEQIEELKKCCTHKNDDGTYAIDETVKDRLIAITDGYIKNHTCKICGSTFQGETVKLDIKPNIPIEYLKEFQSDIIIGDETYTDNLTFDPLFNEYEFLEKTKNFFK